MSRSRRAIEVAAKCPISWIQTTEVRPFNEGVGVGQTAEAFAQQDDGDGLLYALIMWTSDRPAAQAGARDRSEEGGAWRRELQERGLYVLGGELGGADTATTVRVRDGHSLLSDGPRSGSEPFISSIDVVYCGDRQQAIEIAAAHPLLRSHAIEVRPFYVE